MQISRPFIQFCENYNQQTRGASKQKQSKQSNQQKHWPWYNHIILKYIHFNWLSNVSIDWTTITPNCLFLAITTAPIHPHLIPTWNLRLSIFPHFYPARIVPPHTHMDLMPMLFPPSQAFPHAHPFQENNISYLHWNWHPTHTPLTLQTSHPHSHLVLIIPVDFVLLNCAFFIDKYCGFWAFKCKIQNL